MLATPSSGLTDGPLGEAEPARILIADDNLEMAKSVADGLRERGYVAIGGGLGPRSAESPHARSLRRADHRPPDAGGRWAGLDRQLATARSEPSRHHHDRLQRDRHRTRIASPGRVPLPDEALQDGGAGDLLGTRAGRGAAAAGRAHTRSGAPALCGRGAARQRRPARARRREARGRRRYAQEVAGRHGRSVPVRHSPSSRAPSSSFLSVLGSMPSFSAASRGARRSAPAPRRRSAAPARAAR